MRTLIFRAAAVPLESDGLVQALRTMPPRSSVERAW